MRKLILVFFALFFSTFNVQSQSGWFKILDVGHQAEEPFELLEFGDGYYVLIYALNNFQPINKSGVLKFDKQGNFLWDVNIVYPAEAYADIFNILPRDFILAKDSSIYIFSTSDNFVDKTFLINKFDKNGQFLWYKTYGVNGESFDHSQNSLCLAPDSLGVVMTGRTLDSDYVIYQIDSAGMVIWNQILDVPVMGGVGSLTPIVRMPDKTYKIAYDNNVLPDFRDYLASLDSIGNLQYSFVNPLTGRTADLAVHPNGNLVYLSNERNPPMDEDGGMRIQMLTPEFDTIWSYLYFDTEFPYIFLNQGFVKNLSIAPDGKILASGYNGGNNMHLVCMSPEGELLWKREIALEDGFPNQKFNRARWTSDGCIILTGYIYGTNEGGEYHSEIFLLKLDSIGCLEPGCNQAIITAVTPPQETGNEYFTLSPNPAGRNSIVQMRLKEPTSTGFLVISDASGRALLRQNLTGDEINFDVKNWPSGIYTVQVQSKTGKLWYHKLVVQH